MTTWTPNKEHLSRVGDRHLGVDRVRHALEESGLMNEVLVSRDPRVRELMSRFPREGLPSGVEQHQLPVVLSGTDGMVFASQCGPNTEIPVHRHTDESIFRVVVQGSLECNGYRLVAGDWMFVPTGRSYRYVAGPEGCVTLHTYTPAPIA